MQPELLTVSEAAQLKGVSRWAVYKAVADGRLPSRRVLGKVALSAKDVTAWIPKAPNRRKAGPMSGERKARISQGQKRRWAQRKDVQP